MSSFISKLFSHADGMTFFELQNSVMRCKISVTTEFIPSVGPRLGTEVVKEGEPRGCALIIWERLFFFYHSEHTTSRLCDN